MAVIYKMKYTAWIANDNIVNHSILGLEQEIFRFVYYKLLKLIENS